MTWYHRLVGNHVLANLTFALILVVGFVAFNQLPRERDPEINFNWINILTVLPGASATDVEKRVTDPLEDAINRSVGDINFVSSTSRESISNILVRFNQLDERTFDKRVADLRREIQNVYTDQLPDEADDPFILEITSSNGFPTATIVLRGRGSDENFRRAARNIRDEIERIDGVDQANPIGLYEPELHVLFHAEKLAGLGISPADIADTVRAYFRDVSIGDLDTSEGKWVVRMQGTDRNPDVLADYPVMTAQGVVPLRELADLVMTTEEPSQQVRYQGEPAVVLSITKNADTNILDMMETLNAFVEERNQLSAISGIEMILVDDQTVSTREALNLMQNNALIGLVLVLLVTWLFLGSRIALFTSVGIPFTLAGTFIVLSTLGMTLNNSVLLGVVISLGMIVDDAVVVVEAIYYRMQRGAQALQAAFDSMKEVFAPVTTSVLTTVAAFLPLTLLPGILGDFLRVVPLTVCVALLVSLLEAYWILPVHIATMKSSSDKPSRFQLRRAHLTHKIRITYTRWLVKAMRLPRRALGSVALIVTFAFAIMGWSALGNGPIKVDFFAADAIRLFYVNVEMPRGSNQSETLETLVQVEQRALDLIQENELRASVIYAGQMFTQIEPLFGDNFGQIMISLKPGSAGGRPVREITQLVEDELTGGFGRGKVTILALEDGPPVGQPISVKVVGDDFDEIKQAADELIDWMETTGIYTNTSLDYSPGNPELVLKHDGEAIQRAGLSPISVTRAFQAFVDGELVSQFQGDGEEVLVRVKAKWPDEIDIDQLLRQTIARPGGGSIALGELVEAEYTEGLQSIRHYNFRRTITLNSDLIEGIDTVRANDMIAEQWQLLRQNHPTIQLDFSGELDDVYEAFGSMLALFAMGIGIIYLILGTQFGSYWQPFIIILGTLPLAFTGVILGLLITRNPFSLYTLYGVVALAGIAVNAAIVLISAANDRLSGGMSILHATIYAARRRVVPILITSLTTIAGLFSLAAGLAGESLVWGPVATAIVSGLLVSTCLTLFVIPLVFRLSMGWAKKYRTSDTPPSGGGDNPGSRFSIPGSQRFSSTTNRLPDGPSL